jgi:hypothetical protein
MAAITTWYCDNFDILHGMRLGILFAAEAPIDVSQVQKSDNLGFTYMLSDNDALCRDEKVCEYLSRDGMNLLL